MRPKQLLPDSEKNKDWKKSSVAYYRDVCLRSAENFDRLYKLAAGELDEREYTYLTNPQNTNNKALKSFPAKLKNYAIVPSTVQTLLGEKRKRPVYSFIDVKNSDVLSRREREISQRVKGELLDAYNKELERLQLNPEEQPIDIDIEAIKAKYTAKYKDIRAIIAQNVLDFSIDEVDLIEKFQKALEYWITTSQTYTYKDVIDNNLIYKVISPENFGFIGSQEIEYVEDAEACAYKFQLSYSEVIDRFGDLIKDMEDEEERDGLLDYLEGNSGNLLAHSGSLRLIDEDDGIEFEKTLDRTHNDSNAVNIIHVNWKAKKKQKFVVFTNEEGLKEMNPVDDSYVGTDDEEVITRIVNELWEGYEIEQRWYLGIRKVPFRRGNMNNPALCKLLYNGKIRRIGNKRVASIVEVQEPYQHLVNFIVYNTVMTIARNKDNLILFPISLLPDDEEWDLNKILYHVAADGILFVNDYDNDAKQSMQHVRALNLSLHDLILKSFQLIDTLKLQADEAVGISRQRKAQVSASEGVGAMRTAIEQSATINEDLFVEFEKFQERELGGVLDLGKYAFIDGKRAMYTGSEDRSVLLDLTGQNLEDYVSGEYNVRAVSSRKENEKREYLLSNIQALIQNGTSLSTVAEILQHDSSFTTIKEKIREIEEIQMKIAQEQQAIEAEREKELKQMEIDGKLASDQLQLEKTKLMVEGNIQVALISKNAAVDNQVSVDADNQIAEDKTNAANLVLGMEKLKADERNNIRDNATKQYQSDIQLKNKVAGEK